MGQLAAIGGVLFVGLCPTAATANTASTKDKSPIKHVVIILQENHSFDNVLGRFCSEVMSGRLVRPGADSRCGGTTTGDLNGKKVPLTEAPDMVPGSAHNVQGQQRDIDGGKMDGFTKFV